MAEGQTATNPQTGERIVMRGGQWVPMGSTSRPAVQAIPGRVKQPDALDMSRDVRDQTRLIIAQTGEAREGRRETRDIDRTQFDQTSKLRDDFENQPAVKRYRASLDTYVTGLKSSPTPEGDRALITAFAKLSDPTTGVLQGEAASVEQSSPAVERIIANLNNQLDASGGFSPRARESLRQEMASLMAERNKAFIDERVRFKGIADRSGINILDVVGEHPGARFQQDEANALGRPVTQLDYQGRAATGQVNPDTPPPPDLGGGGDQPLSVDVSDDRLPNETEEAYLARINAPGYQQPPSELVKQRDTLGGAIDAFGRGIADIPTFGTIDEISALLSTPFNDQTYAQNLEDQRNIDRADEIANPWARIGGQLAGALALPSGIGRATATGGVRAGAVRAGQEGAAFGGAYGFGSGEDMQSRGVNALLGAAGGAAVGYGAGRAIPAAANALGRVTGGTKNALAQMAPGRAAETARRQGLAADASAQGVDLMPADVGGAMVKRFTAGAAQAPASAERVRQAATQTNDQIGAAVARQVDGKAVAADEAGDMVRQGAEKFAKGTSRRGEVLYNRAKELSKGVKVKPIQAIAKIDELVTEAKKQGDVGKPLVKELTKFRNSLSQSGGLEVQTLRNIRTTLRDEIQKQGLRGSNQDRMFGQVLDAASEDMVAGLTNVGKERAAAAYKVADRFWKDRAETIDDVLDPLIGKKTAKSGEAVLGEIEKMAQGKGGGVVRLSRVMAELSEKEASAVRATVIEGLGRATAGTQNAAGDAFSAATFLTNWNKLSGKGKAILFADKELRANLDQIARLSGAVKDSQRFANTSNTAGATIAQPTVGGFIALIPQNLMGRLMTSKGFTGWLARTPKFQGAPAERAYVQQLEKIAAREPVHSAEIIQLKDYLANRIAQSPQQAAANVGGDERDGRQKPPQQ